ncbi:MAG: lipopolysaccharide biosynthesis protein [Thermaurantimonas sp.]
MFKKLLQTTAARAISAFLGLVILATNARYIGSEGVGQAALFNLWVSIFLNVGNLFGGSAMVYYAPRYKSSELLTGSYAWTLLTVLLTAVVSSHFSKLLPGLPYLLIVVFFYSTGWAHQYVLAGRDKMSLHNAASLSVNTILLGVLILRYMYREPMVEHYFIALCFGSGAQWFLSLLFLLPILKKEGFAFRINADIVKRLFKDGFHIQLGNLVQQFNYRFTYFFLNAWWGAGAVGIFSAVVQLGEGIWLLAKSASLVVYARVSQANKDPNADIITFVTARWVALLSALAMLLLAVIPDSVYNWFLGKDFSGLGQWLLAMTPAVSILAGGMIYSHYISGRGFFFKNFAISLIAFLPILLLGNFLIARFGLYGAVVVNFVSYSITALGSLIVLLRMVHPDSKAYIWRFKPDFRVLGEYLKLLRRQ